ncbi:hypothetical protein Q7P37_008817 [Cladosporium fusiforme]
MSGLEIAGIVLGALPLIIYGLEHLKDGATRLNRLVNFNEEYHKIWGEVEDEELMYRLQLKILLKPLVNDGVIADNELEELMLDSNSDLWRDADVDKALKARLGDSYERYVANLEHIQVLAWQILQPLLQSSALQQRLGSHEPRNTKKQLMAKAFTHLSETYKYERERFKFAIGHRLRKEILDSIHRKIKLLRRILAESDQVAIFEQSNKVALSPRSVKNLIGYWRHADRVYALLLSSWICPCKQNHCAHLWLQHRTSPSFDFQMLVLFAPKGCNTSMKPLWQQHGLQIEWTSSTADVGKQMIASALLSAPQLPMQPPAIVDQRGRFGGLARKGKGKQVAKACVSFDLTSQRPPRTISFARDGGAGPSRSILAAPPSTYNEPASKKAKPAPNTATKGPLKPSQDIIIRNLCRTMAQCGMQQSAYLGMLVDEAQGGQYRVRSQPEQKIVADEISLFELLHPDHKPCLQRAQRLQIALKIASSHLQLHSTPWARRQWESADVRFPQTGTDPANILLDRPFVSADFEATSLPLTAQAPKASDRSFACLGIMLLELAFGKRLEDNDLWQQLGVQNTKIALFRLMVAKQWADDVEGEQGSEFSSAVMWCLNKSPTSLEGNEWRKDLASEVVLPLEHCYEWISPKAGIPMPGSL